MARERIYISGAITGVDNYLAIFEKKHRELMSNTCAVINPALINSYLPCDTSWKDYMKVSLAMLETADVIYMLKGWESSKGARLEHEYAKSHGYKIIYEE